MNFRMYIRAHVPTCADLHCEFACWGNNESNGGHSVGILVPVPQ